MSANHDVVPAAESLVNGDGEVALFVGPLEGRPVGWRDAGGGMLEVVLGGGGAIAFGCAPDPLGVARSRGRILLVQSTASGPVSEAWLPALPPSSGPSTIP